MVLFEEHYKGYLYLGPINPASEAVWLVLAMYGTTGALGCEWWTWKV